MIETARLLLQPFIEEDLATLCKLRSDPEVAQFIGGAEYSKPEKVLLLLKPTKTTIAAQ